MLKGNAEDTLVVAFTRLSPSVDLSPKDLKESIFEEIVPIEMFGAKSTVTELRGDFLGCLTKQGNKLTIPGRLPQKVDITVFVDSGIRKARSIGYSSFETLNRVLVCTVLCKDSIYSFDTKGYLNKITSKGLREK